MRRQNFVNNVGEIEPHTKSWPELLQLIGAKAKK